MDKKILRIRSDKTSLFDDLNTRLIESFEKLQKPNTTMSVFWEDDDDDRIGIQDQSSLLLAMESMSGPLYNLCVLFEAKVLQG